jgi:hypothetical protein
MRVIIASSIAKVTSGQSRYSTWGSKWACLERQRRRPDGTEANPMSEERQRFMIQVERDLDRVRHYLHSIVILLIYGGLIIIGLLGAITLKLFLG